ncbi:hypothetical protein AB0D10_05565 [Kitasatospora sp. NPDC048545]|uniref:hypothetical protein n=1 Tax=Kitasatospora sp. NPDC048545 TaxID=3157208 RepID=UPI0033F49553
MARGHGRVLTRIWDDPDFTALPGEIQRLYLFLISQPNLNHAGLLPLTLKRWSSRAHGLSPAVLREQLAVLSARRFVVVDEDTEELLVRSFVRNDGVWKQPQVMGAMVSGALEITSRPLRAALLAEVERIPLDELSDEPGRKGLSPLQEVSRHIAALRAAFREPDPKPPAAVLPEGVGEGVAEPLLEGVEAGSTRARGRFPLPLPHSPSLPVADVVDIRSARQERPDVEEACTLLADLIAENGTKRPTITKRWRDAARLMIDADGVAIADALGAIRWSQADEFWRSVILSMPKLRQKYPQLKLRAQAQKQRKQPTSYQTYADQGVF